MQMTAAWAETTGRGCSGLRPQVEPGLSTSARGRGLVVLGEGHGFVFVTSMSGNGVPCESALPYRWLLKGVTSDAG